MTDETAKKSLAEIVDVAFEALGRGDMDTFISCLADDAKLIEPVSLPLWRGSCRPGKDQDHHWRDIEGLLA